MDVKKHTKDKKSFFKTIGAAVVAPIALWSFFNFAPPKEIKAEHIKPNLQKFEKMEEKLMSERMKFGVQAAQQYYDTWTDTHEGGMYEKVHEMCKYINDNHKKITKENAQQILDIFNVLEMKLKKIQEKGIDVRKSLRLVDDTKNILKSKL